jgi:Zn-dependent M16 (insulinase) family peptidase
MKNDLDSNLAPSGHHYASGFSGRLFSRSRAVDEIWNGLDQIIFAHSLASLDVSEISARLRSLQAKLAAAGLLVNYTGTRTLEAEREVGKRFASFAAPRPRNPQTQVRENINSLSQFKHDSGKAEVFASPSLQVGFASISLLAVPYGDELQAAELVLSHQLSTGALWENIRMKGGAYGAFSQPDHLEGPFSFTTYRDPNPLASLEAFSAIIGEASPRELAGEPASDKAAADKSAMDKAVIGTYARETRPRSPVEKGLADFLRFLYGIEDRHRRRRIKSIVDLNEEQITAARKRLANQICAATETRHAWPVIIAGKAGAEKAAAQLGVEVRNLPV